MFTVLGDLPDGTPSRLTWDDGKFTGQPAAVQAALQVVQAGGKLAVFPTGPFIDADPADPVAAWVIAYTVLAHAEVVDGEVPAVPSGDVPNDAVA